MYPCYVTSAFRLGNFASKIWKLCCELGMKKKPEAVCMLNIYAKYLSPFPEHHWQVDGGSALVEPGG